MPPAEQVEVPREISGLSHRGWDWAGTRDFWRTIPLGMLLNPVNSVSATLTYAPKRLVDWRVAAPFGATMVVFAPIGTLLNVSLPADLLVVIFAIFTAAAALLMLSGWKPKRGDLTGRQRLALGLVGGSGLGLFAGLVGRGGGSFVVPLLYVAGLDPKAAAATSAFVVTCSGASSFASHLLTAARPDWILWLLCCVAVLGGSQLGSRLMADKMKPKSVKPVFGGVLLGVSALMIVQALA
ncbi:MAG: hypothetical protein Kow0069_28830 [Promethearchaeota archaeon]